MNSNLSISVAMLSGLGLAFWLGHQPSHTEPKPIFPASFISKVTTHVPVIAKPMVTGLQYQNNPIRYNINATSQYISHHWHCSFQYAKDIVTTALVDGQRHHISPDLILGIISVESAFQRTAYSNVGAVGLMQGYPTAHWNYIARHKLFGPNYHKLFNVRDNINFGTHVLSEYMGYKSPKLILSHYFGIAPFDVTYVQRVMKNVNKFHQYLSISS